MTHEAPKALRRRGIARATDNVPANGAVCVKGSVLWAFFAPELRARYLKRHDAPADAAASDNAR